MTEPDWLAALAIFATAGVVKGLVGFGLPTVCLAAFTLLSGLTYQAGGLPLMLATATLLLVTSALTATRLRTG